MRISRTILACAAFLLASTSVTAQDQPVIGVINLEQALFNSEAAQGIQSDIQEEFSEDQDRANQLQQELRELMERAQQDEAVMSDSERRRLSADAQDKQVQLQMISERVQKALQERNQQFVNSMRQSLGQAIEQVVEEGGYDLVLNADSVAFFNNGYSITNEVTARLNEINRQQ